MNLYLACFVIVTSVGLSVVWSDRRNLVGQAFALCALCFAAWLCVYWTIRSPWRSDPVPWLRTSAVLGDFFPWMLWWIGRCAVAPQGSWRDFFRAGRFWAIAGVMLALIAVSPLYIPPESTEENRLRGPGYLPHQVGQLLLFLALPIYFTIATSRLQGALRSRAKVILVGGGITAAVLLCIQFLSILFGHSEFVHSVPLLGTAFYVVAAWIIASQQLLDARHVMLTVLRRTAGLIGAAFIITTLSERPSDLPRELQILLIAAMSVAVALIFDSASGAFLDRILTRASLNTARALQAFGTEIAGWSATDLREGMARQLATLASSHTVAIYWRNAPNQPLRMVSRHCGAMECPAQLSSDHPLIAQSAHERSAWWVARRLPSLESNWPHFALCVPVLEQNEVLLLVLTGHKQGPLGFSQTEISALQSWALACHHTLTTRALLERENAQQQLVYAGKLAAGIAHNIRNPLAIVRAYLEADPALPREETVELHQLALTESARIQSTIDGLAALSRGERFTLVPHDLDALLRRATEINAPYLAECRASVEITGAPGTPSVLAEPWQLTTALTNLLRNSAEEVAREGGGWIRFEFAPAAPGWLELRVRDSGRGLPDHIRDAVFSRDLFAQTTKPTAAPSRRTGFGIGLHSTMLIVTIGHGGRFEYRDQAFVLTLPAAPQLQAG